MCFNLSSMRCPNIQYFSMLNTIALLLLEGEPSAPVVKTEEQTQKVEQKEMKETAEKKPEVSFENRKPKRYGV